MIEINLKPDGPDGPTMSSTDVLDFLLHQAAHSIDTPVKGREGRYHSPAYRDAAERLGLAVDKDTSGYGDTSLASDSRTHYRNELGVLDRALAKWSPTEQPKTSRSARNGVVLICSCIPPRKIRLRGDPDKIDVTGIRCEICESPFVVFSSPE